jgi:hypothetical protein
LRRFLLCRNDKIGAKNVDFEVSEWHFFKFKTETSYETDCPSPDGRENPFVPGFGTKDLEGQQE